ncbi:MAG TPA: cytochrome P450 [Pyrinomonadaceae bacterium]|nr:cytochrome P450 [Pyrinomonadaceae bacterium]
MSENNLPPTVKSGILGGHFMQFRRDPTGFLQKLAKLGDVTSFKMGGQLAFFLNHPDFARDLLITNNAKFIKGRALQRAKRLLGEGLLTSEGETHLSQRRMIQPAFHREKIKSYAESMTEYAAKMRDEWKDGEVRDIDKEMMHLTLQIVGKTLFSANVEDDADEIGAALTTIIEMFNYLLLPFSELLEKLPIPQVKRFNRAKETLDSIIYGIINERRKSGEDTGDLLSMLLQAQDEESGGRMTDEQIRDECLTLFLAGHETTANALTWTFYLLSQNPEKEAKLHEELKQVLQNERIPTVEDLPNLIYTESIFAESLRLFPPAWALGRLAIEQHEFDGYKIPKGSLVLLSQFVMQRDKRFWENAETFLPERWEKQSVREAVKKYVYFPFSSGVRGCIGEGFAWTEGILLIATVARKWKLKLMPEQRIAMNPLMTLRPKFGMKMKIEKI